MARVVPLATGIWTGAPLSPGLAGTVWATREVSVAATLMTVSTRGYSRRLSRKAPVVSLCSYRTPSQ